MKVSVIIPTYNGAKHLSELMKRLASQSITFELIIVDSSSTDDTVEIVSPYADKLLTIPSETFDHGGTRTLAAKEASGELVIFLTQDALPADDLSLETLLKPLKDPEVSAVYGRQLPHEKSSLFGKHLRHFNYPEQSYTRILQDKERYGLKTAFFSDSFSVYRKEALERIGYFRDHLIVGEDMTAAANLLMMGYKISYCAEAEVYHSHSYTITEEFKRYFDTGVFHADQNWLLDTFGKAEGEGKRYIKSELAFLRSCRAYHRIPEFIIRNMMKYLGYKLGTHYQRLPNWLAYRLSMHRHWWHPIKIS